jgi:hypothetical protein
MAFPDAPTCNKTTADFRSISDEDFARLSTEEKFRHVNLGMLELTRALVELAAAAKAAKHDGE